MRGHVVAEADMPTRIPELHNAHGLRSITARRSATSHPRGHGTHAICAICGICGHRTPAWAWHPPTDRSSHPAHRSAPELFDYTGRPLMALPLRANVPRRRPQTRRRRMTRKRKITKRTQTARRATQTRPRQRLTFALPRRRPPSTDSAGAKRTHSAGPPNGTRPPQPPEDPASGS